MIGMKRLPSLPALQLLSALAQDRSLTRAAAKMGLTQSAASRRISTLEADLGVQLIERQRRGVRMTRHGAQFLDEIVPALGRIAAATDTVRKAGAAGPLRLRVYSTLAARWLLPRLPDFQARHPEIDIRLDTTVSPVSFDRDNADLAIQFGHGDWPDADSRLLIPDEVEPVCAPEFARLHGIGEAPREFAGLRLLESHYRHADWDDWSAANDCSLLGASRIELPNSLLAYQAAIEGLGMVMGQIHFLSTELRSGVLVAPFGRPLRRDAGYYLVSPRRPEPRRAQLFRRWISRLPREMATA